MLEKVDKAVDCSRRASLVRIARFIITYGMKYT